MIKEAINNIETYKHKVILELFFDKFSNNYDTMRIFEGEIEKYLFNKLNNTNLKNELLQTVYYNMLNHTLSKESVPMFIFSIFFKKVSCMYRPYYIDFINICYTDTYIIDIATYRLKDNTTIISSNGK